MFRTQDDKQRKRFYLLPGQGGRAYRRKQKLILKYSIAVGILVSVILVLLLYWLNHLQK